MMRAANLYEFFSLHTPLIFKHRLVAPLALCLAFPFIVFFFGISPWQSVVDSDNAVPYLMAHSNWRLQDFYFWRAVRFGSVYVVFWKAFGRYLFGENPRWFYAVHMVLAYSGVAFWAAAFSQLRTRLLFLLFFIPLTTRFVSEFLLPGHLYGMYAFLSGIAFYALITVDDEKKSAVIGGIFSALLFWLHELAGITFLALFAIRFFRRGRLREQFRDLDSWRRLNRLAISFVPIFVFAEVARQWSKLWPVDGHYRLASWEGVIGNFHHFLFHGISLFGSVLFGPALFAVTLVSGFIVGGKSFSKFSRGETNDTETQRKETAFATFVPLMLLSTIVLLTSQHYIENFRAPRYMIFLGIPALFFVLAQAENLNATREWRKRFLPISLLLFAFHLPFTGDGFLYSPQAADARDESWQHTQTWLTILNRKGCSRYVDTYWNSYRLTPVAWFPLETSAYDAPRNPELFQKILSSSSFCASPVLNSQIREGKLFGVPCVEDGGLLVCTR